MKCKKCGKEQKYMVCKQCRPDVLHTGVYATGEKWERLKRATEEQNKLHEDCPKSFQAPTEKFQFAFGRGILISSILEEHGFNSYEYSLNMIDGEIYGWNKK